jgi:hypothetical protein
MLLASFETEHALKVNANKSIIKLLLINFIFVSFLKENELADALKGIQNNYDAKEEFWSYIIL